MLEKSGPLQKINTFGFRPPNSLQMRTASCFPHHNISLAGGHEGGSHLSPILPSQVRSQADSKGPLSTTQLTMANSQRLTGQLVGQELH